MWPSSGDAGHIDEIGTAATRVAEQSLAHAARFQWKSHEMMSRLPISMRIAETVLMPLALYTIHALNSDTKNT